MCFPEQFVDRQLSDNFNSLVTKPTSCCAWPHLCLGSSLKGAQGWIFSCVISKCDKHSWQNLAYQTFCNRQPLFVEVFIVLSKCKRVKKHSLKSHEVQLFSEWSSTILDSLHLIDFSLYLGVKPLWKSEITTTLLFFCRAIWVTTRNVKSGVHYFTFRELQVVSHSFFAEERQN